MIFTSFAFIVFFVLVLAVTFLIQKFSGDRVKHYFLLAASYFFYGWWDWRFCFLLFFVSLSSYVTALYCRKKSVFILGVSVPLLVLGVFKYFGFFMNSLGLERLGSLKIILPVGISFYTFQALSYVIDVHRGKITPEKDFAQLALYISFFPQLVAGPIVRASDFLPQLHDTSRRMTAENFCAGIQIIAFGYFKKSVLADHLSVFVDDVFGVPAAFHWASIILAVVSYSLQIYFDFSGYSDIATGCAKCLGYDFVKNFNLPYISESVTEFWRRWHISLSGWLRDYLYIPLGGNRHGRLRQLVNLMITMLLGGLWHGANWTFVFWGGLNGTALCAEKIFIRKPMKKSGIFSSLARMTAVFFFVSFTWIFFRSESFTDAKALITGIFTLQNGIKQPFFWSFAAIIILIVSEISAFFRAKRIKLSSVEGFVPLVNLNTVTGLTVFFVFCGVILGLAFTGENPFVYFQF
ncbi:MAG: MBOAT family protein [Synergistaceae bacterium]|nr:MBOAT family protein [Synergistaceae bacterium]